MDKMKAAKALMKIVKPYYDDKTGKLNGDAPEKVKEAYNRLDELMNEILGDPELFYTPPYFTDKEKAKEWAKEHGKL